MAMELTSPAFAPMGTIPRAHSCEGANLSPPLNWSGVPEGTMTLLLTCDDPDAPRGVFHHWAAYNIPATATGLDAGERLGEAALNDFRKPGYGGPCPPPPVTGRTAMSSACSRSIPAFPRPPARAVPNSQRWRRGMSWPGPN